jgi:hypothetical protein
VHTIERPAGNRPLAVVGLCGVGTGALLVALPHVVAPSDAVSPVRGTIGDYALLVGGFARVSRRGARG